MSNNAKPFYASKTFWGVTIRAVFGVLGAAGVGLGALQLTEGQQDILAEALAIVAGIIGYTVGDVLTSWGLRTAGKPIAGTVQAEKPVVSTAALPVNVRVDPNAIRSPE